MKIFITWLSLSIIMFLYGFISKDLVATYAGMYFGGFVLVLHEILNILIYKPLKLKGD